MMTDADSGMICASWRISRIRRQHHRWRGFPCQTGRNIDDINAATAEIAPQRTSLAGTLAKTMMHQLPPMIAAPSEKANLAEEVTLSKTSDEGIHQRHQRWQLQDQR